jgi:hypothetical protein
MGILMSSTRVLLCSALFCSCAFLPLAAAESADPGDEWVDLAFFSPDKVISDDPEMSRHQSRSFKEQFYPDPWRPGGYCHIYIRNRWDTPVGIREISIDGRSVEDLREDLTAPWWRVLPESIPPGAMAEVIIRLKRLPDRDESEFRFEAFSALGKPRGREEEFTCRVSRKRAPPIELGYVSFKRKMNEVYIYVARNAGSAASLARVFWDGQDVTDKATFYSPDFHRGTALVKLRLGKSLRYGSYHLVKVETGDGIATASMVRAWDCGTFPCAIFSLEWFESLPLLPQVNLNVASTFGHWMSVELLQELKRRNYKAIMGCGDRGRLPVQTEIIEQVEELDLPVFAYIVYDEPDAKDRAWDKGKRIEKFLDLPKPERLGALALTMEQMTAQYRKTGPSTLTFINLDSAYLTDNINTYAKIPDILSRSTYTHSHGRDPYYTYATGYLVKRACAPRIPYLLPDAAWIEEWGLGRPVEPGEARLKLHYALAAGAKGITWWTWHPTRPEKHGARESEPLIAEMRGLHQEVQTLQPLLSISEPLPETWAESDHEHLWTKTLLCADHSLILILVNKNYDSHPTGQGEWDPDAPKGGFEYEPMEKADVTVRIPDWFRVEDVFRMPLCETMRFERKDDGVHLDIESLEFARMIVLTRDKKLRDRLQKSWDRKRK